MGKTESFKYIKVTIDEDATIYHEGTVPVPSHLSDDEIDDYIWDNDVLEKWIWKEENKRISYGDSLNLEWFRSGEIENPLSSKDHLLVHKQNKQRGT